MIVQFEAIQNIIYTLKTVQIRNSIFQTIGESRITP